MSDTQTPTNKTPPVICFHDGDCPLCNLEIDLMKKLDKDQSIQWVDINQDKASLARAGITHQQAMDQIHVMDENGMRTGVDGFILVWQRLPYFRRLVPIVTLPVFKQIATFGYRVFAKYRLRLTGRHKLTAGE